jgi:hypothetical protein
MKKILILITSMFLVGCVTNPPVDRKDVVPFKYGNDCLPQAIIMAEALKQKNVEARVLSIFTDKWGHAVCVYMYPKGQNKMWAWDRFWKSMRVRAWKDDPMGIAKEWLRLTLSEDKLIRAEFQE